MNVHLQVTRAAEMANVTTFTVDIPVPAMKNTQGMEGRAQVSYTSCLVSHGNA